MLGSESRNILLCYLLFSNLFVSLKFTSGYSQRSTINSRRNTLSNPCLTDSGDHKEIEWTANEIKCRRRGCPTDYDSEDDDLDRREAMFAMLGTVWAVTTGLSSGMQQPSIANAVYGADAKIELPNPVGGMSDRNTKQCLVESLGNRECLVYMDEKNKLYQGLDGGVLFQRLEKASIALATIPDLVAAKKWSAVTGVLTGPMGELSSTMVQLLELTGKDPNAVKAAKAVKTDVFAIGAAAEKKQGDLILKYAETATKDLATFVKLLA